MPVIDPSAPSGLVADWPGAGRVDHRTRRQLAMAAAGLAVVGVVGVGALVNSRDGRSGAKDPSGSATPGGTATSPTPSGSALPTAPPPVASFGKWEDGPALRQAVEAAGMAVYRGQLWVVGGNPLVVDGPQASTTDRVQVFDPDLRRWKEGKRLPVPLHDPVALANDTTLYVVGGSDRDGEAVSTTYRFNEDTQDWEEGPELPAPRSAGAGVWDGERFLYAGGRDQVDRAEVYELLPDADEWTPSPIATLSPARDSLAAVTNGAGTTWFLAGQFGPSPVKFSGAFEELTGSTITRKKSVPARRAVAGVYLPGLGPCMVGGRAPDRPVFPDEIECPLAPPGAPRMPRLLHPRGGAVAVVLGDSVYVVGGFLDGVESDTLQVLPFTRAKG